jgi:transposase
MMTLPEAQETIARLERELAVKDQQVEALTEALEAARKQEEKLDAQVKRLLKQLYGPKSEAFTTHPDQLTFEDMLAQAIEDAVKNKALEAPDPEAIVPTDDADNNGKDKAPPKNRHKHGRRDLELLEDILECHDIIVDVHDDEKVCLETGQEMVEMDREITRQLEIVPQRIIIRRIIRIKYISPGVPESGVLMPQLPPMALNRWSLGPGLIAQIIVGKYCDHMPLYRQQQSLAREGVELSRSTMSSLILHLALRTLKPLYQCLIDYVLSADYIFSDDTRMPIQVRNLSASELEKLGSPRMWVYGNAAVERAQRQVFYDFTLNRSAAGPERVLADYEGYLQADAYCGYDALYDAPDSKIIEIGCMGHARRKFTESVSNSPKLASEVLGSIRELYRIEHKADKDKVDLAERLRIRQESSTPIVTALWTRMEAMQAEVLPSSAIGGALTYAINQKVALQRFLEDARFRLDNNWAENHMRPMAVGRKNFLTVGSKDGGDAAAIMYSFTESCRLAGINPLDYFRDVIPRLSYHPRDRLAELLPCNWSPIPPTGDRIIMPPMPRRQATTANA